LGPNPPGDYTGRGSLDGMGIVTNPCKVALDDSLLYVCKDLRTQKPV